MDNTPACNMITRCSTHFPIANHNVVMARARSSNAKFAKHQQHHIYESVESEPYIFSRGNERPHQIIHIRIDTASSTLPAIDLDTMCLAIIEIHLILQDLVPSKDNARLHLPHEETVGLIKSTSHKLLHRQIKRKATDRCVSRNEAMHLFVR